MVLIKSFHPEAGQAASASQSMVLLAELLWMPIQERRTIHDVQSSVLTSFTPRTRRNE